MLLVDLGSQCSNATHDRTAKGGRREAKCAEKATALRRSKWVREVRREAQSSEQRHDDRAPQDELLPMPLRLRVEGAIERWQPPAVLAWLQRAAIWLNDVVAVH